MGREKGAARRSHPRVGGDRGGLNRAPPIPVGGRACRAFRRARPQRRRPGLLFAIVQTSLAEEIFFRGFLGKRIIARRGFAIGNAAQAIVFGILHVALFASFADPVRLLLVGILTGSSGWIAGWINEKSAGGSILPGWALHASANLLVGTAAAFNLMG